MKKYLLLIVSIVLFLSCEDKKEQSLPLDCAGVEGGTATFDSCGFCTEGTTGFLFNSLMDCAGECFGNAEIDSCGVCDNNTTNDCVQDCNGDWGGDVVEDVCEVCGGDNSSCPTITDIDGNIYPTVQIGNQNWIKKNLKVTHYNNGHEIPTGHSNSEWTYLSTGAYSVYLDDSSLVETYGYLYNWYVVDDSIGICPEGWHVPSDIDFKELEIYLGMNQEEADGIGYRGNNEGGMLKKGGENNLWNSEICGNPVCSDGSMGCNCTNFSALPGGYRDGSGSGDYHGRGIFGYFWSYTDRSSLGSWSRVLYYDYAGVLRLSNYKDNGFSIRCIED